jgi:drug/metabolite transporter (DMT)-like permease
MATVINKRFEAEQEAARAFANTGIRSAGRSLSGLHGSGPFLTLTTAAAFASSTIAGKFASEALNPGSIILLRSLIALMFLAILAAPQGTAAFKVSRRHLLPIALLGASGIVGYVYFFLLSLNYTALSHTAIISSLSPMLTAVAAAILIGERLSIRSYLGVGVSFGGVLLLLSQGNWNVIAEVRFNYGDCLMLLVVACSVFYGLVAKILSCRYQRSL